ncbi:MAG: 2-phosphosulfolactate phosphatase [Clostridia bacterium]|nr:2-phosphosulfolactate phosphatase [Clostridia bacterium]
MNIKILHLVEGAKEAKGITVIIDVFRAFSVEAYIMNNGVGKLIPVGDMQIAYDYKKENPDAVLIGERKGVMLPGFDYGNSPSQIENIDFNGKTVIHTTSSGTQGIVNAVNAEEIITGSLVNAKAISKYIKNRGIEDVSLVAMGLDSKAPIEEDTLCALYIKSLLEDNPMDLTEAIEGLKLTSGAKFFKEEMQSVFPKKDFELCTQVDKFDFVIRLVKDENGMDYMERVDVK